MAVVNGQIKDASVNGKPRDLSKLIFNVSPTDTPFLTMCDRTTASQTLHEWQTDALTAPGANAQKEGIDVTTFAGSNTTELSNKTQILMKAVNVSGTAQAVVQNGAAEQYTHQMALRKADDGPSLLAYDELCGRSFRNGRNVFFCLCSRYGPCAD